MITLQNRVDRALDIAVFENEFTDLMQRTPREVALDLCTYGHDFEQANVADLEACVKDYQAWYQTYGCRMRGSQVK